MINPNVSILVTKLKSIIEAQKDLDEVAKYLLASPDLRTVPQLFQTEMELSMSATLNELSNRAQATSDTMLQLTNALYYLELETIHGKGKWREIIASEPNLRLSLKAIASLRESHQMGLFEAKQTVLAYNAGLFK